MIPEDILYEQLFLTWRDTQYIEDKVNMLAGAVTLFEVGARAQDLDQCMGLRLRWRRHHRQSDGYRVHGLCRSFDGEIVPNTLDPPLLQTKDALRGGTIPSLHRHSSTYESGVRGETRAFCSHK